MIFTEKQKKAFRLAAFLKTYCNIPTTPMVLHKIGGTDGNGKEIEFSDAEKKKIGTGLRQLSRELEKKAAELLK